MGWILKQGWLQSFQKAKMRNLLLNIIKFSRWWQESLVRCLRLGPCVSAQAAEELGRALQKQFGLNGRAPVLEWDKLLGNRDVILLAYAFVGILQN